MTALPKVSDDEAHRVAELIRSREGMQRAPTGTAKILLFMRKLELEGNLPFPTRTEAADHLGVPIPLLDMVVAQRTAQGDIEYTRWVDEHGWERFFRLTNSELADAIDSAIEDA